MSVSETACSEAEPQDAHSADENLNEEAAKELFGSFGCGHGLGHGGVGAMKCTTLTATD